MTNDLSENVGKVMKYAYDANGYMTKDLNITSSTKITLAMYVK